jgi:hypothetical protein
VTEREELFVMHILDYERHGFYGLHLRGRMRELVWKMARAEAMALRRWRLKVIKTAKATARAQRL